MDSLKLNEPLNLHIFYSSTPSPPPKKNIFLETVLLMNFVVVINYGTSPSWLKYENIEHLRILTGSNCFLVFAFFLLINFFFFIYIFYLLDITLYYYMHIETFPMYIITILCIELIRKIKQYKSSSIQNFLINLKTFRDTTNLFNLFI